MHGCYNTAQGTTLQFWQSRRKPSHLRCVALQAPLTPTVCKQTTTKNLILNVLVWFPDKPVDVTLDCVLTTPASTYSQPPENGDFLILTGNVDGKQRFYCAVRPTMKLHQISKHYRVVMYIEISCGPNDKCTSHFSWSNKRFFGLWSRPNRHFGWGWQICQLFHDAYVYYTL